MDNRKFKQIVAGLYEKMEYRPVGVFLLYDEGQRFLISQSAKDPLVWGPPQGGVEANENIFQNLERELREELGIKKDKNWLKMQLALLQNHRFYTRTTQISRDKGKQENIARVESLLAAS